MPSEAQCSLFLMDYLESLDFSSYIIISNDPWALLVIFLSYRWLFNVQCCDVICRQPLNSVLNVKVLVKLEKALVGAISVIVKTDGLFAALVSTFIFTTL